MKNFWKLFSPFFPLALKLILAHFSHDRDSLRQAMIQRSLSFSQMSVIDYGASNPNELGKSTTESVRELISFFVAFLLGIEDKLILLYCLYSC